MTEVCVRWVPPPRTYVQKMNDYRCETLCKNLKFVQLEWYLFVRCTVTDNETWIHQYDHQTK